jgi:hypothetical protein
MRECLRVLKPGGWAIFMVPVTLPATFEDPTISDPATRERLFGQRDHVRRYGMDIVGRLEQAGFGVATYFTRDVAGSDAARYAILSRAAHFSSAVNGRHRVAERFRNDRRRVRIL